MKRNELNEEYFMPRRMMSRNLCILLAACHLFILIFAQYFFGCILSIYFYVVCTSKYSLYDGFFFCLVLCFVFFFLFYMQTTLVTINSHYSRVYQFCASFSVYDAYFVNMRLQCSHISGNLFNNFSSVA